MTIHREQDYIIRFLTRLNDEYENAESQILMMDPVSPLTKVFSLIQQQETKNQLRLARIDGNIVNLAKQKRGMGHGHGGPPYSSNKHGAGKICMYCGKTGHMDEMCYQKHGYALGSRPRKPGSAAHNIISEDLEEREVEETPQIQNSMLMIT